jgi:hypothetical protein
MYEGRDEVENNEEKNRNEEGSYCFLLVCLTSDFTVAFLTL